MAHGLLMGAHPCLLKFRTGSSARQEFTNTCMQCACCQRLLKMMDSIAIHWVHVHLR